MELRAIVVRTVDVVHRATALVEAVALQRARGHRPLPVRVGGRVVGLRDGRAVACVSSPPYGGSRGGPRRLGKERMPRLPHYPLRCARWTWVVSASLVAHSHLHKGAERPHDIGDGGVHVVHAVDIQPRAPERLGRPCCVARFQRVQRRSQRVPRDVLRADAARTCPILVVRQHYHPAHSHVQVLGRTRPHQCYRTDTRGVSG